MAIRHPAKFGSPRSIAERKGDSTRSREIRSLGRPLKKSSASNGTLIEDAPLWMLCIVAVLIAAAAFPGVVGLQDSFFGWDGTLAVSLEIAGAISILITAIMATRKSWRRDKPKEKPTSARLFTWIM